MAWLIMTIFAVWFWRANLNQEAATVASTSVAPRRLRVVDLDGLNAEGATEVQH